MKEISGGEKSGVIEDCAFVFTAGVVIESDPLGILTGCFTLASSVTEAWDADAIPATGTFGKELLGG